MRPPRRRVPSLLQLAGILSLLVLPFALRAQTAADSTHVTAQRINADTIGAALTFGSSFCQTKTARSYPTMCRAFAAANRRFIFSTAAESALVASTVIVAPPVPAPAPTTTTTDTGWTVLASTGFTDSTYGPLTNPWGKDIDFPNDPTASGRGRVARMHYAGSAQDVNRAVQYENATAFDRSHTLRVTGEFYLPAGIPGWVTPTSSLYQRKLIYLQRDPTNSYPEFWVIVTTFGNGLSISNGYVPASGVSTQQSGPNLGGVTLATDHWYTIELQATLESAYGKADGVVRLWLDGKLVHENTAARFSDPAWAAPATAQKWRYIELGDQVNTSQSFDEYRYWDNIALSTKPRP